MWSKFFDVAMQIVPFGCHYQLFAKCSFGTVLGDLLLPEANSVDSRTALQSAFVKLMKFLVGGSSKSTLSRC